MERTISRLLNIISVVIVIVIVILFNSNTQCSSYFIMIILSLLLLPLSRGEVITIYGGMTIVYKYSVAQRAPIVLID